MDVEKIYEAIGKITQYQNNAAQCPLALYQALTDVFLGKKAKALALLIGGEALVIKCKDEFGQKLCLKIPRLEILQNAPARSRIVLKNLLRFQKTQEIENVTAERFSEGAILQRNLVAELEAQKVSCFTVPRVFKISTEPILHFVMEWFDAPGILTWLKEQNSVAYSLRVFKNLLLACNFLHERGIVHRDIKSDNILIGLHDSVVLLDWTLAKVLDETRNLTIPGSKGGTTGYAPQKFIQDGDFKAASFIDDVYMLGLVFWEFLSLEKLPRLTLEGYTTKGVLEYRKKLAADLPEAAQAIFWTATEQKEEDRYQTCAHFLRAVVGIEPLFAAAAGFVVSESATPTLVLELPSICAGCGACCGLHLCEVLEKFIAKVAERKNI